MPTSRPRRDHGRTSATGPARGAIIGALLAASLLLPPERVSAEGVDPVDVVDLQRYAGRWYEIAVTPTLFEIGCYCVTANYGVLSEDAISVFNACNRWRPRGRLSTISGVAEVVDPVEQGRLVLTFGGPSTVSDYWIVDLVEDPLNPDAPYRFTSISDPNGAFLFVLFREPVLSDPDDAEEYLALLDRLADQGLPVDDLTLTPQPPRCDYDAQGGVSQP